MFPGRKVTMIFDMQETGLAQMVSFKDVSVIYSSTVFFFNLLYLFVYAKHYLVHTAKHKS